MTTTCTYETPCGWCTKLDKKCDRKISCGDLTIDKAMHGWFEAYLKGAGDFMEYLMVYARSGKPIYESEMKDILIEFAKKFGEVNAISA